MLPTSVHSAPQLPSIWYIPVCSHSLLTPQYFSDNLFCLSYFVLAASDRIIEDMEVSRITARAISYILSSQNLILSPPTKRIKLQMPVSFTVAVKLFAGSKLPRRRIALAAVLHSSCYFHQDFEEMLIHLDAVA